MFISFGSCLNDIRYQKQTHVQKLVFYLDIGQKVKVKRKCFGNAKLRGGLGPDLNTLEGLCLSVGLEELVDMAR